MTKKLTFSLPHMRKDFWGPASNFGIPIAAVLDTQKDAEMYVYFPCFPGFYLPPPKILARSAESLLSLDKDIRKGHCISLIRILEANYWGNLFELDLEYRAA